MIASPWPSLPVDEWADTRDTLQLWTQMVGKIRMSHSPLLNHWWNVPLYVTARGLTTSLMWSPDLTGVQIDFDFVSHELIVDVMGHGRRALALVPRSVADLWRSLSATLEELGVEARISTMPSEINGAIRFEADETHGAYDAEMVTRWWRILVSTSEVMHQFRSTYVGKASPVHLFWGALDLATTRFSGRAAPPHPGGAPHCAPHVMIEAYSHEVSSAGYWPGGGLEGAFYSYAYPEPPGYREVPVMPGAAYFDHDLGEFILPYEAMRKDPDPRAALLTFLHSTYAAAADRGGWDRPSLERDMPPWTRGGVALPSEA